MDRNTLAGYLCLFIYCMHWTASNIQAEKTRMFECQYWRCHFVAIYITVNASYAVILLLTLVYKLVWWVTCWTLFKISIPAIKVVNPRRTTSGGLKHRHQLRLTCLLTFKSSHKQVLRSTTALSTSWMMRWIQRVTRSQARFGWLEPTSRQVTSGVTARLASRTTLMLLIQVWKPIDNNTK